MADYLRQWFQRKTSPSYAYLRKAVIVTHTFHKHTGPRFIFGEVTLAASPAETFSFESKANWPERNNDSFVLDGILDVLIPYRHEPILGAAFILTAIGWHVVDSLPMGYYFAAKEATKRVLHLDNGQYNIAFQPPNSHGKS